jgi:hypothetical protein
MRTMDFPCRKALIYGDSIFLKGIAETLRILPELEVMEACPKTINTLLADARPDVVFVDAAQMTSLQVESLLSAFPDGHSPSILRLDARNGKMTVLFAQQFPAASFTNLRQALELIFKPDSTIRRNPCPNKRN